MVAMTHIGVNDEVSNNVRTSLHNSIAKYQDKNIASYIFTLQSYNLCWIAQPHTEFLEVAGPLAITQLLCHVSALLTSACKQA